MKILGVTPDDNENPHDKEDLGAIKRNRHGPRYKPPVPKFVPPSDENVIEYVHRSISVRKDWINELATRLGTRRKEMVKMKEEIADIEKRLLEAEERLTIHMNALISHGLIERHGGQR